MSLPYSFYRQNISNINGKSEVNTYSSAGVKHSINEMWRNTFYTFICLWLLCGGLLELGSNGYLASNIANFNWESSNSISSNSEKVVGVNNSSGTTQPSSFKSDLANNLQPTNANPLPDPSSSSASALNLTSNNQSSVNSVTTPVKYCQTKNRDNDLLGGATSSILTKNSIVLVEEATPDVCNYSYYSSPNLIVYEYSDDTFSTIVNVSLSPYINNHNYGNPTIFVGQVFLNEGNTLDFSAGGEFIIPNIFRLKINNQIVLDRANFTTVETDINGKPCNLEGNGTFTAPMQSRVLCND